MITLDCHDVGVTDVNRAIRALPAESEVVITEPRGAHNIGVALMRHLKLTVEGNTGYYLGGLCDGPNFVVNGSVGWGVGENLMSGSIVVNGNASESAGATAHGGLIVINGDASLRAGISLKGGTIAVAGSVGNMAAFMAQAGTILVGGDAGDSLGDSLYEAVVYVAGNVGSLGADAKVGELTEDDVRAVRDVAGAAGFDHVDPANVTKVVSAKELYNFDALKSQRY